jgi:mRNA interferase MazF
LKDLDFSVVINSSDLDEGELKKISAIRADKLYTLAKQIVKKKFGHVQKSIMDEVIIKINQLL